MQASHDPRTGTGTSQPSGSGSQDGGRALDGRDSEDSRPLKRKRRDMKACASCRRSKVKCDGNRPCRRCANSNTDCIYPEVYKDPTTEKLESLEREVLSLKSRMENVQSPASDATPSSWQDSWASAPSSVTTNPVDNPMAMLSIQSGTPARPTTGALLESDNLRLGSSIFQNQFMPTSVSQRSEPLPKKRWRAFQWQAKDIPNVVVRGIVSEQQAQIWFQS